MVVLTSRAIYCTCNLESVEHAFRSISLMEQCGRSSHVKPLLWYHDHSSSTSMPGTQEEIGGMSCAIPFINRESMRLFTSSGEKLSENG